MHFSCSIAARQRCRNWRTRIVPTVKGITLANALDNAPSKRKTLGSFYTPEHVAETLVNWVVRSPNDRLLDPSCGDGRFLASHRNVVGVDLDPAAIAAVVKGLPHARVYAADFFDWAKHTRDRFECVVGNPPFIRYQKFSGDVRRNALEVCARVGVKFSSLTSSWAPFVVAAASLLKPGGRLAFVVPAEIGHAPYAKPVLRYLLSRFHQVSVIAVREKVFPGLSEDVWVLYADGFGGESDRITFSQWDEFPRKATRPNKGLHVSRHEWEKWGERLRSFLISPDVRDAYREISERTDSVRLGEIARVGIGYVSGANDLFHLRPSEARQLGIPNEFLRPTVRRAGFLRRGTITPATVEGWLQRDEPVLLLHLPQKGRLPDCVMKYLDTASAQQARLGYKCRNRNPWYTVPDVTVPDAFLAYMSGLGPRLVLNNASCACTNSIHAVHLTNGLSSSELRKRWTHPFVELSCEIEGHPLGGGMLKLEPREAARIVLPSTVAKVSQELQAAISEGVTTLRRWRHYV